MRWLSILSVGCAAAASGNLGWTVWRYWELRRQMEDEARPDVRYVEPSLALPSPFIEIDGGVRILEHERGWAYDQALFLPDIDSDGCADVALVTQRPSMCGNDTEGELELYSGARLTLLGQYAGPVLFSLEVSPRGQILEGRMDSNLTTEMFARDDPRARPRWSREWDFGFDARLVDDFDGDGFEDLASACSWIEDDEGSSVGEVRLHSGRNGRPIWTKLGPGLEQFGWEVTSAGDWDRDGCPDLAVLAKHSIVVLSGRHRGFLAEAEVLPDGELLDLRAAGDLDGDGRVDFRCTVDYGLSERWVVFCSSTWQPLDVSGGWPVLWCANDGDLDGDGRDDLVVGRLHHDTGERRISLYSAAGLTDVRVVHVDDPPWTGWTGTGTPSVGRFRDGEPWYVLLPIWNGANWCGDGHVVVYPGV
jgi:hypothetical protein